MTRPLDVPPRANMAGKLRGLKVLDEVMFDDMERRECALRRRHSCRDKVEELNGGNDGGIVCDRSCCQD